MQPLIDLLAQSPLLTLFVAAGLGFVLGRIKVAGVAFGVAAVLFVGLGLGALDPRIQLPEIITTLGLVIFVYTLGLSSGPGFFQAFKKRGVAATLLTLAALGTTFAVWWVGGRMAGLNPELVAGGFTGSVTNTAALAAVLELTPGSSDAAVGYAITYPMGVVSLLLVIWLFAVIMRRQNRLAPPPKEPFVTQTIRVAERGAGRSIHDLTSDEGLTVIFGRVQRGDALMVAESKVVLEPGDLITAIGTQSAMEAAIAALGEVHPERIDMDRREIDYRRIVVSNPAVFGKTLAELRLPQAHDAMVTRLSRGDVEFLPDGATMLEPGDRLRVVTRRSNFAQIGKLLGDSYKALGEIDVMSFALGICIGLLIGMIEVPLPGGVSFKLGVAGGPLVVSLLLGALHRTGPIHWGLSYNANLTLRQIGLILFLAGVGVRSGDAFRQALTTSEGWTAFAIGSVATTATAVVFLIGATRAFKVSGATLMGMVSGVHTQPAALGFAAEHTKSEYPNLGYATVFPIASISKIILAQVLLQVMR